MAKIKNPANVDITDRPVNGTSYTIRAGETVEIKDADAAELLDVYGFLTLEDGPIFIKPKADKPRIEITDEAEDDTVTMPTQETEVEVEAEVPAEVPEVVVEEKPRKRRRSE